jgi:tyrosyl-tRNA synthetase
LAIMNAVLDELSWRGFIAHSTDPEALRARLAEGPITFYVGFDPTAPSIHMGNLVQLMLVRLMQGAGHRPLLLVGGSTGLIGDPKQTSERNLNPTELVHEWVERIRAQVSKFVSFDGDNAARLVNNYDWTAGLSTLDFLRDIGKHFSVNRMLDREVVKARLESGISYTEFSYVLLQSLDYLELHRRYGCELQTGGSDQWGNITAGVDLIRRAESVRAHAMATPLLTKADGTKFGKTESGTVWLDPAMTSPYAFHQFFLNAEDTMVGSYLRIFTTRSAEEIADLERQTAEAPHLRAAQRALADDITDLVHSVAERRAATAAAGAIFGRGDLAELDAGTLAAVAKELDAGTLPAGAALPSVVDVLAASGVVASKGAARRAIAEGGAYLNNQRVTDPEAVVSEGDLLAGEHLIVRRGKRTVGAVRVVR